MTTKVPKVVKESKDRTPMLLEFRNRTIPFLQGHERIQTQVEAQGMTPLSVLSIDPGRTNIALCYIDIQNSNIVTSKIDPPDLKGIGTNVYYREMVIAWWIEYFQPEALIVENVTHAAEFGVAEAGRLQYIVERLGIHFGLPVIKVSNSTMRKFVGASGGDNTKSDVKLRVFQKWAKEFASEDECDAFAVAQTGIAILRGEYTVNAKKEKVKK